MKDLSKISPDDPFSVLQISSEAEIDDIKKSFRKLIRQYHPDINGGNRTTAECIIDAYHKAIKLKLKQINKPESEYYSLLFLKYEMYFGKVFVAPGDKSGWYFHVKNFTGSLRDIVYSTGNMDFFDEYVSRLISDLSIARKRYKEKWLNVIYGILENYKYLLIFRREISTGRDESDEYALEKLRLEIFRYFKSICDSVDYLSLRIHIFQGRDGLLSDCVRAINTVRSRVHRQEIFAYMSLIMLYSEADFYENMIF